VLLEVAPARAVLGGGWGGATIRSRRIM